MDEDIFGGLLRYESIKLNECSDSIGDLLLVRKTMQVVPESSQCSAIVLPCVRALPVKKGKCTRFCKVRSFFKDRAQRPRQPLKIETKNKAGTVVQKLRR